MARPPFFVFVHDLGQTPLQWEEQVSALPPGVGAACPWLRGTRPGGEPVSFSVPDAAAALITTLDEHGAAKGVLVGVGLGGTIALHAAAQAGDRVERVMAVSATTQPSRAQLSAQRMALRMVPRRTLAAQNLDKDRLLAALRTAGDGGTSDAFAGLTVPVTLIAGGRDKAGLAAVRSLAEHLPDVHLALIPDGDADLPRTAAPQLNALLFEGIAAASDEPLDPWDLT